MSTVRILSWNIGGREEAWRQLAADASIDVALLQEAKPPPRGLPLAVVEAQGGWETSGWEKRPFRTAVVRCSKRVETLAEPPVVPLGLAGPAELAVSRPGTLAVARVLPPGGMPFTVASVYAAWERPVPRSDGGWIYGDASAHRLVSDLSALVSAQREQGLLVAGDWNILHGYGEGGSPYWGNRYRTVFERLEAIGLTFVGPERPAGIPADPRPEELPPDSRDVPTFRTSQAVPASAQRQLDFVFASADVADRIAGVAALNGPEEWGVSDHCRVVIDIRER